MIDFIEFPKIARLSRECIVTEKIDGTSGTLYISPEGEFLVGSRTRWITPDDDNHGFARWAIDHKDELTSLGQGWHRGEWWGSGIQRGYGLPKGEKRFSLFNVIRWCLHKQEPQQIPTGDPRIIKLQEVLPPCVGLVPVLYRGLFDTKVVGNCLSTLQINGSQASLGFMRPEGVVVWHVAGNIGFKKTIERDEERKGERK
jgi:hypothetical protein